MAIVEDGKKYFKNTLDIIHEISGKKKDNILKNPTINIESYAFSLKNLTNNSNNIYDYISAIKILNELPNNTNLQQYAKDSELYSILILLNRKSFMQQFGYSTIEIDFQKVFGKNLKVLSARKIFISANDIYNKNGENYKSTCSDYALAIWAPANSSNYSSRNGTTITDVTIHTIQGTYASCISWFQNPSANVSAHYVIRSFDGQVTQMICESDKGWHVGSENSYTIGIEHEGFVNDPTWLTDSMYDSSADLVRDITTSGYTINPKSVYRGSYQGVINSCYHIKGHVHFPNQSHTDPGVHWDWNKYYHLINNQILIVTDTNCSGTFIDSGGVVGSYSSFQSYMTVISPTNADSIVLSFNSFDLELNYDTMAIYDGTDTSGILIGSYTGTNSPGTVVGNSGSLAIVFYSDCLYNNSGWDASWNGNCIIPTNCTTYPTNLYAYDIIHNSVKIGWDNMNTPTCMVDKYFVRFRELGTTQWTTRAAGFGNGLCNFGLQTTTQLLVGFTPATTYEWRMKAFYCGGGSSNYSPIETFTTANLCPDLVNLSVQTFSGNHTKAKFSWDSTGAYLYARVSLRVDTTGSAWQTVGGFGTYYPALIQIKFGLQAGQSYRAGARAYCNSTISRHRSGWTPFIFWTQPGTLIRIESENSSIENLSIYPNPSRYIFNITFTTEKKQKLKVRLVNVIGEQLITEDLEQFLGEYTKQIDLTTNAKGIYLLEIETDDGVINKKLILQ
jgi:N-acetyl-anhydromuramyl-L-alanine amidase AmpD